MSVYVVTEMSVKVRSASVKHNAFGLGQSFPLLIMEALFQSSGI